MGLSTLIQIPCHHVLANQNALKLKNGAPRPVQEDEGPFCAR